MKKIGVIVAVLFSCLFVVSAFAQEKIGYVDVAKLFDDYQKTKDFDKMLEDKVGAYDKDREAKVAEIKQMQDKLNILSDKEKEAKQKELEAKVKTIRDYTLSREGEIRKERDDKFKEILDDIEKSVKQYAQQTGYTLVMNSKVLVYNNGSSDITAEVAKILQAGYKK